MKLMRTISSLLLVGVLLLLGACSGSQIPKTVKKQGSARKSFEMIRQSYFDTGNIPATREALDDLAARKVGHVPDEVFKLRERLNEIQWIERIVLSYQGAVDPATCGGDLARLKRDRGRLTSLRVTSHGAEKYKLQGLARDLDRAEGILQDCVANSAVGLDQQERLLATSQDPAVIRPIIDRRDAELTASGDLNEILDYLRLSQGYAHAPALIRKTDELLAASDNPDLIAAYLFYYSDHRHDDQVFFRLEELYLATENWPALEASLQRFQTRPHSSRVEQALQGYYREQFRTGSRLWDEEKFAEAAGYLALVAPRSPQYGAARSLLREAADMGYYRWEQPDVWIMVSPYRW
ncbi:MAG: hypothetical protein GY835_10930 [bacterium]|nr:hypothetical protein [bacterium]